MHVHQFGEFAQFPRFKALLTFQSKLANKMKVLEHAVILLFGPVILLAQNRRGGAIDSRKEQHQIVLQVVECLGREAQRMSYDTFVGLELKTGDAPICSDILILLANGFL